MAAPAELYRHPADIETATFVGEAVILPADVEDGTARCALGRVAVGGGAPGGQRTVMLRPEQIAIEPADTPGGAPATVLGTTYYGHDATVRLALSDGTVVLGRPPGYAAPQTGERVTLLVRGTAHVFAAS